MRNVSRNQVFGSAWPVGQAYLKVMSGKYALSEPPLLAFALTEPTFGKKVVGAKNLLLRKQYITVIMK